VEALRAGGIVPLLDGRIRGVHVDMRDFAWLSLAKTRAELLSFTPLTMLQPSAQAVDFKVGRHFGEGRGYP